MVFIENVKRGEEKSIMDQYQSTTYINNATDIYGKKLESHRACFLNEEDYIEYEKYRSRRLREITRRY